MNTFNSSPKVFVFAYVLAFVTLVAFGIYNELNAVYACMVLVFLLYTTNSSGGIWAWSLLIPAIFFVVFGLTLLFQAVPGNMLPMYLISKHGVAVLIILGVLSFVSGLTSCWFLVQEHLIPRFLKNAGC